MTQQLRALPLSYEQLSPKQRDFWDSLIAGPRGTAIVDERKHLKGAFDIFLRSPDVSSAVAQVGERLRFLAPLSERLRELCILTTTAYWKADVERSAHEPRAIKAGISPQIVKDIASGSSPVFNLTDERITYDLTREILLTGRCETTTFQNANSILGEECVLLVAIATGYYSLLSFTMGVFDVQPR